ncbi:MAG: MBL fold metallo-hydrolase [Cyanobium sp. PLM2.Bin73]|nr:MAG: MBL fold metallo-hydrolase [Cyanobium sp. PLM2.Bin73]
MPRLPRAAALALALVLLIGLVAWWPARAQTPAPPAAPAEAPAATEPAAAQPATPAADPKAVTSEVVRGPVGVIRNEGGNIGVLSGPDGILLVDAGFARQAEPIRAAIAALAAAEAADPRLLVSTHFHADHTDGNAGFVASGALLIAHENTHRRLAEGSMLEAFQLVTPPAAPANLPPVTFERDLRLRFNSETIDLQHLPAAHTDGDLIVRFRNADVIHAADVWFNGMYPFIDTRHGATLAGAIAGVDRVLLLAGEDTRIIPGHGPVGGREELATYRAMLATVQGRLNALKAQGFTLPQVLEARPLADLEATWGQGMFSGDRWLELLWNGV